MSKRILLIHNPISGGTENTFLEEFKAVVSKYPSIDVKSTTHVGHARALAEQFRDVYDIIGAVGGDGTINEIATAIVHTKTKLGIIPYGSANGLAYHLGIPLSFLPAMERLVNGESQPIDVISVGNRVFVNVAGIGFDGHVNKLFNQTEQRGLWSYARLIFTEYLKFKEFRYQLIIDGITKTGSAFFIVLANTTQYGHNFHIAPNALTNDGILHVMLIKKPPFIKVPWLMRKIFKGNILQSKYCEEVAGKNMVLEIPAQSAHFDGETPDEPLEGSLQIEVMHNALQVIY